MWNLLCGWYDQIWPNLAASAIALPPSFIWHHRKIRAHITATVGAKTAGEQITAVPDARTGSVAS